MKYEHSDTSLLVTAGLFLMGTFIGPVITGGESLGSAFGTTISIVLFIVCYSLNLRLWNKKVDTK